MHEVKVVKKLFEDLLGFAQEQKAKKITKVFLRMGEFAEINQDSVHFYFQENAMGTPAEGAEVEIENSLARELTLVSFDCI